MTAPAMTTAETTQAVIWLDRLAAAAAEYAARYRQQLADTAFTQYAVEGVAPTYRMPDVATVSTRIARDAVTVTDPAALLAWVAERHPEQVQQQVRTSYIDHLRRTGRPNGTDVVDPDGEVVPGLAYVPGGRFLGITVKPTTAAAEVFGALAEESLQAAALTAAQAIAANLAALLAGETPGELDPTEVPE